MRLLAAGLMLLMMQPMPALAQASAASCAAISEDAARLACYDGLFRDQPAVGAEAIIIESERLIPAQPVGRQPALMQVSCKAGEMGVLFSFAGQVISGTSDIAPIAFQVDQNPTSIRSLFPTDKTTEIEFQNSAQAEAFLDTLDGANNLKVRVTPLRQRSLTVDFRLAAHAEAIAALRQSCR